MGLFVFWGGGGGNWASELGLRVPGCRIQGSRVLGSSGARRLVVGGGGVGGECGCCTWLGNELSCSSLKVLNSPAVRRAHAGLRRSLNAYQDTTHSLPKQSKVTFGATSHTCLDAMGQQWGKAFCVFCAPTVQSQAPIPSQAGRSEQVWIRSCANLTLRASNAWDGCGHHFACGSGRRRIG